MPERAPLPQTGRVVGIDVGISAPLTTSAGEKVENAAFYRAGQANKSIFDSGRGIFKQLLTDKAANAGREVLLVNPAYTSKCCANCGSLFQDFDLSTRWVECACGLSLDRDHNAALNILKRAGWDTSVQLNAAPLPAPNGKGKHKRAVEAAPL